MNHSDNLKLFFEKIKSLTFWQRIFSWNSIRALSYEAYEEFRTLSERIGTLGNDIISRDSKISEHEKNLQILSARINDLVAANQKLETRTQALESDLKKVNTEKGELASRIARFEQTEQSRLEEFQKNVSGVNAIRAGLENDRQKLNDERIREKEESLERMKQTWQNHQTLVKEKIKGICQTKQVDYIEKVPFKGSPDNTIRIAGEYIIFDAKSPGGEDLENFPKYLKIQTDGLRKYVKQENVKSDIFLVVPSNTLSVIGQFTYNMAEYNVFIISIDALDPIITYLKKIEEYDFVRELSPEERDNICRIIGRFTHTAKRKIQIDYFFSYQFLEILSKCNIDLPEDFLSKVEEFEKAEKLNPPMEKRAKQILFDDLLRETEKLALEAKARIADENKT